MPTSDSTPLPGHWSSLAPGAVLATAFYLTAPLAVRAGYLRPGPFTWRKMLPLDFRLPRMARSDHSLIRLLVLGLFLVTSPAKSTGSGDLARERRLGVVAHAVAGQFDCIRHPGTKARSPFGHMASPINAGPAGGAAGRLRPARSPTVAAGW